MLPHFEVIPHQDITNYNTFSIWHLPLSTWIGYESKFLFYYNTTGMSTNFIQVWYSSLTKVLSCWEPIFESSPYKIYHLGRHIWIPHEGKKCDWVVKYIVAHVKTYMMSSHYIPHYHLLVTPIYPPFANALVHFSTTNEKLLPLHAPKQTNSSSIWNLIFTRFPPTQSYLL